MFKFCILMLSLMVSAPSFSQTDSYGPTKIKETLWDIATYYKKPSSTMYQLMVAFYNKNPDAFYDENMNRLKQNIYLKIPSENDINAVKLKAAFSVVNKQSTQYESFYKKFIKVPEQLPATPLSSIIQNPPIIKELASKSFDPPDSMRSLPNNANPIKKEIAISPPKLALIKKELNNETKIIEKKKMHHEDEPLRFSFGYDVSVSYDDNIRLAQKEVDIRSDVITNLIFKVDTSMSVSKLSRFKLGIAFDAENYSTFNTLNSLSYSLNSSYLFAAHGGYSAPLYVFKLSIGGIESNSAMRTSNVHKIGINMNKRLASAIHITAGLQYKQRESQSQVFDTNEQIIFFNFDYSLSRKNLLYATYHNIAGDKVSSATPSLDIINISQAIEPDDAFGGIGLNQFAYKVDTETHVLTFGFNKRISRKMSYDISTRFVSSKASDNNAIKYNRMIIRAGLLGKF